MIRYTYYIECLQLENFYVLYGYTKIFKYNFVQNITMKFNVYNNYL